jgi:hypothetical protein
MKVWTFFLLGSCAAACSQHQDLANSAIDAGTPTFPSQVCSASPVDAGTPPPIVAVWDGYMEQSFMSTGDDQVHMVIRSTDTGQLSGTVVFGASAPPPPVPANSDSCDAVDPVATTATGSAGSLQLLEGFEYQLTALTASDVRLKFNVPTYQPLASWCACQTPFPGSTICLPNVGVEFFDDRGDGGSCAVAPLDSTGRITEKLVTSCCRIELCESSACKCDPSGCSYDAGFGSTFDLSINGTHADGSALHLLQTQ